jgi:predicted HTH domain antitoxin
MQLTIEDTLVEGLSETELLRELAIGLYQHQKIGFMAALKLTGYSQTEFLMVLRERGLPIDFGYDIDEYRNDLRTLDRLFARP